MTDLERKEINDALYIVDQILPLLGEAKAHFKSARNWGFFDILGGGFITDLIKHSKLGNAANVMNRINYLLMDLQRELKDIRIPTGYNMNTNTFSTFADFVFDGALADIYVQSKIMSSLSEVEELERRLLMLKQNLTSIR